MVDYIYLAVRWNTSPVEHQSIIFFEFLSRNVSRGTPVSWGFLYYRKPYRGIFADFRRNLSYRVYAKKENQKSSDKKEVRLRKYV